ncbi:g6f-like [Polyodon spathula]|uniref:g6f-like n=1 Tax=Polyodon spathula TaxID=7913 RepID=UPI001B7F75FB|nr:g6f-like [Polyodon spathula]
MDIFNRAVLVILTVCCDPTASKDVDWDKCVVTHVGVPVSLPCSELQAYWLWKPLSGELWLPVISAKGRLANLELSSSEKFSLTFEPGFQDAGRYACQGQRQEGRNRISGSVTLLIVVRVTGSPVPVPVERTLWLSAKVSHQTAKVSWISPKGTPLHCREDLTGAILAKLPRVTRQDQGNYICQVLVPGAKGEFLFNYTVTVIDSKHMDFNMTFGPHRSGGAVAQSRMLIPCVTWPGADLILLYWKDPDSREMDRVFEFDFWRRDLVNKKQPRLQLAESDPTSQGNYSFLLTPDLEDNGAYRCEVFRDSKVYIQSFSLTVLQVWALNTSVGLKLNCLYRGPSRVTAGWTFQNQSLMVSSTGPGSLYTEINVNRSHRASWQGKEGNYSCTVTVAGRERYTAIYALTLPPAVATDPLQHPAESSRTLLVLLGAALGVLALGAAGILLCCKQRSCQRHLGIHRRSAPPIAEQDNLYENLEELRKEVFTGSDPHSSEYMDLRPSERDIYNELDRYQTC